MKKHTYKSIFNDILRDWWIKNIDNKELIVVKIAFDILIIMSGAFGWAFAYIKMIMSFAVISHAQIHEFLPVSDSYRKRKAIIKVLLITTFNTILFLSGLGFVKISHKALFRELLSNDGTVIIFIWVCMNFFLGIHSGVLMEANRFKASEQLNAHQKFRGSYFRVIVEIAAFVIEAIFYLSLILNFKFFLIFMNTYAGTVVMCGVLILLIADSCIIIKNMNIGDWSE